MRRSKLFLSRETLTRLDAGKLAKARGGDETEEVIDFISYTCVDPPPPPDNTGLP